MEILKRSQTASLIKTIKSLLRSHRLSQTAIAQNLGVTTRTVRRWLSSDTVDTGVLEDLCALVNVEFFDLCEIAAQNSNEKAERLTLAQEQILVSNPVLWYLFHQMLRGWDTDELRREARLPEHIFTSSLVHLEKAGLIDLLPYNKFRLKTVRNLDVTSDGPYARHINKWLRTMVEKVDVSDPASAWALDALKLSRASITYLKRRFEDLKLEARELSEADRRADDGARDWYLVMMSAMNLADIDILEHMR